ncbi:MAG: FAD:protein FMN transferase [Deltaproteobacteria bacterium]|nr:FAD:protein FMN transferase [Deltaproteobacteria bacterium]MBW2362780.1 FAD:protein FMN transferase [Deltaproteobacteria bacterium]
MRSHALPPQRLASLLVAGALALACAGPPPPVVVSDGRYVMGTVLEITLVAPDEVLGREALGALFELAGDLDAMLSVYAPQSELSQLNATAGGEPRRVSPELARLLARSVEYSALSGGSFDVTVGPLIALWKRAVERDVPPTPAELARARARVGYEKVHVGAGGRVGLAAPGVSIDLGGIAKGWALDRMRPVLERFAISDALLSFGQSSVWAVGRPSDGDAWRLLVRGPGETLLGVIELAERALSVSGSLSQSVEIGGQRYGHVIDPRSGQALRQRRQALVLAPDATLAEALSKALLVLGEDAGMALIEAQPRCEALLVDTGGEVWTTRGWNAATRFERFAP